tara:strand:+ start:4946 stop:5368 length:423 start_codon:yes stop_codon:yes gene_type:complete
MTDTPLTDAEQATHRARYALHDRIWARVDDLHGKLYWEDAQLIGDDLARDYITVAEADRRVAEAVQQTFDAIHEYLLESSGAETHKQTLSDWATKAFSALRRRQIATPAVHHFATPPLALTSAAHSPNDQRDCAPSTSKD